MVGGMIDRIQCCRSDLCVSFFPFFRWPRLDSFWISGYMHSAWMEEYIFVSLFLILFSSFSHLIVPLLSFPFRDKGSTFFFYDT